MAPGQTLNLRGIVSSRGDVGSMLKAPGDAVLVERARPRLLLLSCPCGCREEFPINLDPRAGPAWRLYRRSSVTRRGGAPSRESLSVYPSIWRESGCQSHYIIWDNRILLFGRGEDDYAEGEQAPADSMTEAVFAQLPRNGLTSALIIADAIGAIPWEVLGVCRRLVTSARAYEGTSKQRGWFGRR